MPADEHLGGQFKVYHGTASAWSGPPSASREHPLHVASDPDLPGDYAWPPLSGYDVDMDYETLTEGHIKEFDVDPAAKIHYTDQGHFDGVLDEEGQRRAEGHDMTIFREGGLGIVYNPEVLHHVRNIGYKEHTRLDPDDEMEYAHGEDWRDQLGRRRR